MDEKQKLLIWLVALICLTITINVFLLTLNSDVKIEYRDRIVKEACILNCTQSGNQILCQVPDNKNLTINRVEYYTSTLK